MQMVHLEKSMMDDQLTHTASICQLYMKFVNMFLSRAQTCHTCVSADVEGTRPLGVSGKNY